MVITVSREKLCEVGNIGPADCWIFQPSLNVRLRYNYRPNSDFFIIYNQTTGRGLERPSYQLQFKLTYDWAR